MPGEGCIPTLCHAAASLSLSVWRASSQKHNPCLGFTAAFWSSEIKIAAAYSLPQKWLMESLWSVSFKCLSTWILQIQQGTEGEMYLLIPQVTADRWGPTQKTLKRHNPDAVRIHFKLLLSTIHTHKSKLLHTGHSSCLLIFKQITLGFFLWWRCTSAALP